MVSGKEFEVTERLPVPRCIPSVPECVAASAICASILANGTLPRMATAVTLADNPAAKKFRWRYRAVDGLPWPLYPVETNDLRDNLAMPWYASTDDACCSFELERCRPRLRVFRCASWDSAYGRRPGERLERHNSVPRSADGAVGWLNTYR